MLFVSASMPVWLKWGFWVSPLTYGEIGLSLNEFLAPRWQKVSVSLHTKKSSQFCADTTAQEQGADLVILWLFQRDQQ